MENDNPAGADDEFARRLAESSSPAGEPAPVDDSPPVAPASPGAQPPQSVAADVSGPVAPVYRAPEFYGADELAAPPPAIVPAAPAAQPPATISPAADLPASTGPAVARSSYLPPTASDETAPVARHAAPDAAPSPVAPPTPDYPVVNPYLAPQPAPDFYSTPAAAPVAAPAPTLDPAPEMIFEQPIIPAVPDPAPAEAVEQLSAPPAAPIWSAPQYNAPLPNAQAPARAPDAVQDPAPTPPVEPQFTAPVYTEPLVSEPLAFEPTYPEPVYPTPTFSETLPPAAVPVEPLFVEPAAPEQVPASTVLESPIADPALEQPHYEQPHYEQPAPVVDPFEQSFTQAEFAPPQPQEPAAIQTPHPETAPLDRLSALFEPTGPSPVITEPDPQPVSAQHELWESPPQPPEPPAASPPLVEPVVAAIPLVEPVAPVTPVAEPQPVVPPNFELPTYEAPAVESPAPAAGPPTPVGPPPTAPAYAAPAAVVPTVPASAPPPVDVRQPTASPESERAGVRTPLVAAGSPAVLGLLSSDSDPVPDQDELARSTVFEKVSLGAAVVLPVVGLGVAITAAARSARRRGWVIGLVRASVVLGIASTIAGGIGGAVGYNALLDQRQHDTVEAASAQFCATVAASPDMLELPTFGWPAPAGTIPETLAAMQAYQDKWTALAAVSPSGIAPDASQVATAAGTIITSVEQSRTVNDATNIASMTAVAGNSGVPAWAAEYCG